MIMVMTAIILMVTITIIVMRTATTGLCPRFGGTIGGVRGQRSRRYWSRLREGESEQQVVP